MTQPRHRPIRSFVRREGRLTVGQRRALEQLLPRYGLDPEAEPQAVVRLLEGPRPVTVEIGFGNGESLAQQAAAEPGRLFLGIEVHRPGVGHLLQIIEREGLENLRVICADAVEVLKGAVPDASLDCVQIFFPDPWPKKRHHKRRIVQPEFVRLLARKLRPGGRLHLATDWEDYALWMREVMEAAAEFDGANGPDGFADRGSRPPTKFEHRGERLGHGVWDLVYLRR